MKFEQMYSTIFNSSGKQFTLAGCPSIGKTKTAMELATKYVKDSGKRVLYIVGDAFKYYYHPKWKSRITEFPEEISENIVLWNEIYKYRSDFYLIEKIRDFCEENKNIGLIVFDDDRLFDIDRCFIDNCKVWINVKIIFLTHIKRSSERRRKHIPKLRDIGTPLAKQTSAVFVIYRESYYSKDNINASDEEKFIRLK